MDVQALDSVVTVLPPSGPAQSQSRADNSTAPAATATAAAAPVRALSSVSAAPPVPSSTALTNHVAYKLTTSPVQTVIVFTNSQGVEVGQFPPQQLIALVKFDRDHTSGSHVDRDV